MTDPTPQDSPPAKAGPQEPRSAARPRHRKEWFGLRRPIPFWQSILLGGLCLALCLTVWWGLTWSRTGEIEGRLINAYALPSPYETFSVFPELWSSHDGELTLVGNTLATIRRLALGFLLAVAVGVPLGVLSGCFDRIRAFLAPVIMFGRNIPIAALLPLVLFIPGEWQKIIFIFVACVSFIISDTAQAIADVPERYVDTAFTLGANRWQTIIKVLFPLALPNVFNSCRLLFGLAFGYIMLSESIKNATGFGGLGSQINVFQRQGPREGIYLILLIIPIIAVALDRLLLWTQHKLFPHQYGGDGILNYLVRMVLHAWDDFKRTIYSAPWPPVAEPSRIGGKLGSTPTRSASEAGPGKAPADKGENSA